MKDIQELYNTVIKNDYSYGSGAFAVINNKIKMELNEYGEYKPNFKCVLTDNENIPLQMVCPNSDKSLNEDEISKKLYAGVPGIKYDNRIGYYKELYAGHVLEG